MNIPADIPRTYHDEFAANYQAITQKKDRLLLFAGDQKIEHLNENFYGQSIHPDASHPKHLFEIAHHAHVGAFATQLGLVARWGADYPSINYIIKLNSKTNIIPHTAHDPISTQLWSVDDVLTFKKNTQLPIRGIGYTVYLGSIYEDRMLHEAAQAVYQAHLHGLVAILWMYPRGHYVDEHKKDDYLAGATGVAASLGADFVKINPPQTTSLQQQKALLNRAVQAAGNTKVICSGGPRVPHKEFLTRVHHQVYEGLIAGSAIGRNIYQQSLPEAIAFARALRALIIEQASVSEALAIAQHYEHDQRPV
ncbi:aldolase [Candidatus Dependentiae bacterium]|nr:aldolase [Candidatus Dependentiae bacterium]